MALLSEQAAFNIQYPAHVVAPISEDLDYGWSSGGRPI